MIAAGGGNKYNGDFSDALIAFALPAGDPEAPPLVHTSRAVSFRTASPQNPATVSPVAANSRIAIFSHKRHAELEIACTFCHETALNGERAGFPAADRCMTCHGAVATDHPAIRSLAAMSAERRVTPEAPVYRLPDFVFFRHARHSGRVPCAKCHGDVAGQDVVQAVLPMKMKACVDCHQATKAPVTCSVCHELGQ